MAVRTYLSRILVLAFLYFLFGWAVARLGQNTGFALIVFPSAGLALGACLYYGPRLWPGVWIGSFAYYLFFLKDAILLPELSLLSWVLAATGMAFAATAQALLGYFLFHRFNRPGNPFYQVKEVLSFIVLVGMLVGTVSASVNLPVLIWSGFLAGEQLAHEWVTWWLGDLLGVLIVTPVFLVWRQPKSLEWNPSRRVEACMLFLLFVVASQVVFGEWLAYSHYPLVYLLFPCLVWAAYRFGHYGAMGAILLVSLAAVWGTAQGRGPFVLRSPQESMALLQIYLLVLTVMTMILTAAATQAEEAQTQAVRFGRILDESS
ncbi:MAG: hypothetical protein GWM98_08095, partial [Nitrospinaceae bacterium]|nr:hypothetical protein [Nitrospinaceae bacterium]NIR54464.1 hypothetical protein [Nitrospinaceae bacterium]NIS84883.1 hypothetical protein [Nitrospinaceae bacterium]NIT81695.1 hypothetical protein [Nitrospinaceae bacterium]NIU43966.1 hypothetical protein [Nitrospinaceae bacterium]